MRSMMMIAAVTLGLGLAAPDVQAAGCLKGAAVGGVAGHVAGHGVLGALGGCVVGRHMANKAARENQTTQMRRAPNQSDDSYQPAQ